MLTNIHIHEGRKCFKKVEMKNETCTVDLSFKQTNYNFII